MYKRHITLKIYNLKKQYSQLSGAAGRRFIRSLLGMINQSDSPC